MCQLYFNEDGKKRINEKASHCPSVPAFISEKERKEVLWVVLYAGMIYFKRTFRETKYSTICVPLVLLV